MQPSFSLRRRLPRLAGAASLFLLILGAGWRLGYYEEWGPDDGITVKLTPVRLSSQAPAGWQLAEAWRLDHRYLRLSGLSGLDVSGGRLWTVTDHGMLYHFRPPVAGEEALELVYQPLPKRRGGDSEALVLDDRGGGAIAYERFERIERYDDDFAAIDTLFELPGPARGNSGIEALERVGGRLVALTESGEALVERDGAMVPVPLTGVTTMAVGAAALDEETLLLLQRGISPLGFSSHVSTARVSDGGVAVDHAVPLGFTRLDNPEGIAIATRPDGKLDVWIVSDDNRGPPQRTLLVRYVMDPDRWPVRPSR